MRQRVPLARPGFSLAPLGYGWGLGCLPSFNYTILLFSHPILFEIQGAIAVQISSIRQNAYQPRTSIQAPPPGASFDQAVGDVKDDGDQKQPKSPPIKITVSSPGAPITSSDTSKLDYTNMTPRKFAEAAQAMYGRGEIDLDQLFKMEWVAGGIFKNTPASESDSTQPVNYVKYFQDQLAGGPQFLGDYMYKRVSDIVGLLTK